MILGALSVSTANAQTPDVVIRMDLNPTYRVDDRGGSSFRWYDTLGRHSTVGISMILEPGYRFLVTERIQRMPSDDDQLDEYYLEDEGNWRVGKQYLPFGRSNLIRESVRAARIDSNLLIEGLPITIAACDGGNGRQKGVIGRVGSWLGISLAIGNFFGIDGTSLAVIRDPEDAPGKGRGYRQIAGIDFFRRLGMWRIQAEMITLRQGETAADKEGEVSDLNFSYQQTPANAIVFGWSKDWRNGASIFRVQAKVLATRSIWIEPLLRFEGAGFKDFSISLRAKL